MDILNSVVEIVTKFATIGGGFWAVWGVIILGTALKDKNGPDLRAGTWQTIGGAMIVAGAQLFANVVK